MQWRLRVRALATAVLLCLLVPAAAGASATQETILQDDNLLLYRGDDVADRTLAEIAALGVDRVRVSVHWRAVAPRRRSALKGDPTDPRSYEAAALDKYDHLARAARRAGVQVLFNVTGPAPPWASGRSRGRRVNGQFKPSARGFGQFVEMLGRRYDGTYVDENARGTLPRVDHWSVWNEPNQGAFLQPQWERRRGRWVATSPRLYRGLVRAALAGLARSGHAGDQVLLGETAPLGAGRKGRTRAMAPGRFLTELLCLDHRSHRPVRRSGCDFRSRGALAVTGFAHHPYPVKSPPGRRRGDPQEFALADRDELARLLDAALAARRFPAGLPLWFTEFGWQTAPPDPFRGIGLETHASYLAQAERITRQDPRVASTAQFLLRDDDPWRKYPSTDPRHWTTYQTGLEFDDGRRKPAYDAFRLPLVATTPRRVAPGGTVGIWGLVRPATPGMTPKIQLEFAPGTTDDFAPLGEPIALDDPAHAFTATVVPPGSGRLRFAWTPPAPPGPPPGLFARAPSGSPATMRSSTVRIRVG